MINLEYYKIFIEVANELNITKASEKLGVSQPAITKQIKKLEELLNTNLFERSNKGLKLTETGKELYAKLKEPIEEIVEVEKNLLNKEINIGSHIHMQNCIFGNCLNQFYKTHGNIKVNLLNLPTNEMLKQLEKGSIDIVFSKKVETVHDEKTKFIELGNLNDIFIVSKQNKKDYFTKEDIKSKIIYMPRDYSQTANRLNALLEINKNNIRNSSYSIILELVSSTDTIGFITKEYIKENELEKYHLKEVETELTIEPVKFGVYYRSQKNEVKALLEMIKKHFNYHN